MAVAVAGRAAVAVAGLAAVAVAVAGRTAATVAVAGRDVVAIAVAAVVARATVAVAVAVAVAGRAAVAIAGRAEAVTFIIGLLAETTADAADIVRARRGKAGEKGGEEWGSKNTSVFVTQHRARLSQGCERAVLRVR